MEQINRQILLIASPQGKLAESDFRLHEAAIPVPCNGELLLRTRYISLDAANRAWMQGATYRAAVEAGEIMAGLALAEILDTKASGYDAGELVLASTGWQDYACVPAATVSRLPKIEPITHLLSVYGVAGLTAYFGLLKIGRPKMGDTLVVSAAAGSVGSLVGQIAKLMGCRVIGIAGGEDKCAWLMSDLGFDGAVDYRAGPIFKSLKAAAPGGIDIYFDNVGGDIFEACLAQMRNYGRIVCCGAVSQYDGPPPRHGPRGVPGLIVVKRLSASGFIVSDFAADRETALADLQAWVGAGKLKVREDIIDGLEHTPGALVGLLAGQNRGKRMVRVA